MTREQLRELWDAKELADRWVNNLFARNIASLSATERFDHDLDVRHAIDAQIRAVDAFNAASREFSK